MSSSARRDRERAAGAKPQPRGASSPVTDRLRATEEALEAARATISQHQKREMELRRRLEAGSAANGAQPGDPALEAKVGALKKMQDQKVRALMRSIGQLKAQIQALKAQDQEHRRSVLVQSLRRQQREQELLVDVLKQALLEKAPEFGRSRAAVDEFVTKKAVGGPLRFRPKTREELEDEMWQVDQKYKGAMEQLRQERKRGASAAPARTWGDSIDEDDDSKRQAQQGDALSGLEEDELGADLRCDPALEEELARLRAETVAKTATIHSQADEIGELYAELDRSRVVKEKAARKKLKIAKLREQLAALEAENLVRVREKEAQAEKCVELEEELQFLRDLKSEDVGAKDEERLEALEQIQMLRSRELELQRQLEEQQKRWALDRTTVGQQLRLVEKEKQLLEDEKRLAVHERTAASKSYATALRDVEAAQTALHDEKKRSNELATRVQELEQMLTKQQALSAEEREALQTSSTEKLRALGLEVERKTEQLKSSERQLNAAKLLMRQTRKDKEQLEARLRRLETPEERSAA